MLAGVAYSLTVISSILLSRSRRVSVWIDIAICVSLFGVVAAVLVLDSVRLFSRAIFGLSFLLSVILVVGGRIRYVGRLDNLLAATVIAAIGAAVVVGGLSVSTRSKNVVTEKLIHTAYYPVTLQYHDDLVPESERQAGGASERMGKRYIAVTGSGAFYEIASRHDPNVVASEKLSITSPSNAAAFDSAVSPNVIARAFA